MTFNSPDRRSAWPTLTTTVTSVCITLAVIFSTWLISGRSWLRDSGAADRQIAVNTARLDRIEQMLTNGALTSRSAHAELQDRVAKLESSAITTVEQTRVDEARDQVLAGLRDQIIEMRSDIRALQAELRAHDAQARKVTP